MTRLEALMRERVSAAPTGEETEYDICPNGLTCSRSIKS